MTNQIVEENNQTDGRTPMSVWDADYSTVDNVKIEGFATDISVNTGETIGFKINALIPSLGIIQNGKADYHIEIYRLGYYDGDGARLVATINNLQATAEQLDPVTDSRGVVDAGNWSVSATWDTTGAVSGVYIAKIVHDDYTTGQNNSNQIPFIVRNDSSTSDIVFQTSDTTWQAYNGWGGKFGELAGNFYGGGVDHPAVEDPGLGAQDRAYAVSYNRPFTTRDGGGAASGAQDYLFGADYAAIYWLEKNGYDVTYIAGVDTDRYGATILPNHTVYLSVGHDEYWSGNQRANVEAARDAGVNLQFWSGNEIYWKTRFEDSIVDGQDYRTLVSYKETWANGPQTPTPYADNYANIDPRNDWTGTWRDGRFVDAVDGNGVHTAVGGGNSENSLSGQLFRADGNGQQAGMDIPAEFAALRFWRDTAVGSGNGTVTIGNGILGYEWDVVPNANDPYEAQYAGSNPPGLIKLSETTVTWGAVLQDEGNITTQDTVTHNLSLYKAENGALVFGAGTVFWSWGLSDNHDSSPYGASIEDANIKQAMVNLFADMGVQPGSLEAGLTPATASTDVTAPTIILNDLADSVHALQSVLISGTAIDPDDGIPSTDDGLVAAVEVSFDGGQTWRVADGSREANGTYNWSYLWRPTIDDVGHVFDIEARAIDDSLNFSTVIPTDIVTVDDPVPPSSYSLFDPVAPISVGEYNDKTGVELGVKFFADQSGYITGLRYYRGSGEDDTDTDVRPGHLWAFDGYDANGALLNAHIVGTVTFTSTPGDNGWQTAFFDSPIAITDGTTYIASYHTDNYYVADSTYFTTDQVDPFGVLTAPADTDGDGNDTTDLTNSNGIYVYGASGDIPTTNYLQSNYFVDVIFTTASGPNDPPVISSSSTFTVEENQTAVGTVIATDGDLPITYSLNGGDDASKFTINNNTGALSFISAPDYENPNDVGTNHVYDVIVRATDGLGAGSDQAIQVTVTDVNEVSPPPGPDGVNLFGPSDLPAGFEPNDAVGYELGVRFEVSAGGTITALRYYRDVQDASDTDVRTGNLWSATGDNLGSVTFTSLPGESGWQVATFTTPIHITANTTYLASYGTDDNYVYTANYFTTEHLGPDGYVTAYAGSSGGNGIYNLDPDLFPNTASGNNANYWVDVYFDPDIGPNNPPTITSPDAFSIAENQTAVGTVTADDLDGTVGLVYSIAGGDDAAKFSINATTGALSFKVAPDFEAPTDVGNDHVYNLTVQVSDGQDSDSQDIAVTVTDVEPEVAFDGSTVKAEYIFGTTADTLFPLASATQTATVGAGVEFQNLPEPDAVNIGNGAYGLATVDLGNNTIRIEFPLDPSVFSGTFVAFGNDSQGFPFNGVRISDEGDTLPEIRGISIAEQVGFTNHDNDAAKLLTASNVTFSVDSLFLNVSEADGASSAGWGRLTDIDNGTQGRQAAYVILAVDFNDAPVAANDTVTTDEDTAVITGNVLTNDSDPDNDVLTVSTFDAVGANGGTVTYNNDGTFTYDPNGQFESLGVGDSATDSFTYTVDDGHGGTSTATVTVTIDGVNDAPVAANDTVTTDEDTAVVTGNVLTNDSDPDNDVLTVSTFDAVGTNGGTVTYNNDGTFTYDPNGQFESLGVGDSATDSFTYTVDDGHGGTSTATVTVTIDGLNDVCGATVTGGSGNDSLDGTPCNDSISSFSGNDTINGYAGNDTILAGNGNDSVNADAGEDNVRGGSGDDIINGGGDADSIIGDAGNDTIDGDDGNDTIGGGGNNDILVGGDGDDSILGGTGNDSISGDAGADIVAANDGNDTVDGGTGSDSILGAAGNDILNGDDGNDTLNGGTNNDTLNGGNDNDSVLGGNGDDDLNGGSGADTIRGDTGNDSLSGDDGADRLEGGPGNDTMTGGTGADRFIFRTEQSTDSHHNVNVITDYDASEGDKIELKAGVFVTHSEVVGGNLILTLTGDDLVHLNGVTDLADVLFI